MKALLAKFYLLIFFLFGVFPAFSEGPPPPRRRGLTPPPPPGLPIDENIFLLVGIAILFGIYIINKNNLKTKNPI
jgi:hypothetical protein